MAAYPAFNIMMGSSFSVAAGAQLDTATNGASRGRTFYTTPKRRFRVTHRLNDADLATLLAFHATNADDAVTFTWLGTAFSVLMASDPAVRPVAFGLHEVAMDLLEA